MIYDFFETVYMRGKIHLQLILLRNFRAQFRFVEGQDYREIRAGEGVWRDAMKAKKFIMVSDSV